VGQLTSAGSATGRENLTGTVTLYADDALLLPPNARIATDQVSVHWSGSRWRGGDDWVKILEQY